MKKIIKVIYGIIPFKKWLFLFLKTFWSPPKTIYQHLHFKDTFTVTLNPKKYFRIKHYGYEIENEIFWNGIFNGWEKESMKIWAALSEKSNFILDIGANTGVYSLVAKSMNPAAEVFAFEPVNRVYKKLVANAEINSYDIKCYEKAVSNTDGEAVIYDLPTEHTLSVSVNQDLTPTNTTSIPTKIETITLSSFIMENNLTEIDLIKIDVETHESEVIEGFGDLIFDMQPTLLIEILNDEIAQSIEEKIAKIGYLYFNIDENNGIRRTQHLSKSDFYNFLICKESIAIDLNLI